MLEIKPTPTKHSNVDSIAEAEEHSYCFGYCKVFCFVLHVYHFNHSDIIGYCEACISM